MFGVFWTNGQICSSTSRLIIHESIYDKVINRLAEETKKIFVGNPFSENNPSMGPLVSKKQQDIVLGYIESAKKEGAKVLVGGKKVFVLTTPPPLFLSKLVELSGRCGAEIMLNFC